MGTGPAVPSRSADALNDLPRVRGRLAPDAMFPARLPGYRTQRLALRSGERVRIVAAGPETGQPVVFICGWGCSAWDFNRTLAPIARAGYHAIAIDPRGHGLSDMPADDSLYATEAMVGNLTDALDALGLAGVSIVGHSMGGALAAHLALAAPHRVRALVLISAVGFGHTPIARFGEICSPGWTIPIARIGFRRWMVAAGLRMLYRVDGNADPRNVDEYWAPSQFAGFVPAMRALLHRFRWTRFSDAEVERIEMPTLIVRGTHDPVVRMAQPPVPLPPGARELVIPESGHLPHDEAADTVNAAMLELFARA